MTLSTCIWHCPLVCVFMYVFAVFGRWCSDWLALVSADFGHDQPAIAGHAERYRSGQGAPADRHLGRPAVRGVPAGPALPHQEHGPAGDRTPGNAALADQSHEKPAGGAAQAVPSLTLGQMPENTILDLLARYQRSVHRGNNVVAIKDHFCEEYSSIRIY